MKSSTGLEKSLVADYDSKNEDYFSYARPEMLDFVPLSSKKILDVGCGQGAFGASLRKRSECEVWGVEPDAACIPRAKINLNKVLHECLTPDTDLPSGYFDCIVFNDVIEHILDPTPVLRFASSLLAKNGIIVASIPNIGHFPIVWKLMVHGEWNYTERGILDKTHLRFYTRNGIRKLFEEAGFEILKLQGINDFLSMESEDEKLWWKYRLFSWIPFRGIRDMRYLQFAAAIKL